MNEICPLVLSKTAERAFLLLGSNIEPFKNVKKAISLIEKLPWTLMRKTSSLYETEPVGYKDQPWFINCCLEISTWLSPRELLFKSQEIEKVMGRKREVRWGPRLIDIDILLYGERIIREDDLTIPHPQLHKRLFALIPLSEIAPDILHPILKVGIKELISTLSR